MCATPRGWAVPKPFFLGDFVRECLVCSGCGDVCGATAISSAASSMSVVVRRYRCFASLPKHCKIKHFCTLALPSGYAKFCSAEASRRGGPLLAARIGLTAAAK